MSDLADRISRAAVAALDLAPFDDRYGKLSRQVLAGGASRFSRVTSDDQAIHFVIPVGLAGERIEYGALVLQDRQAGLIWRDALGIDHSATVPRGPETATTFSSLTLGGDQWMRFDVDAAGEELAFLIPPVNSPLLRSTLIDFFKARPGAPRSSAPVPEPVAEPPLVRFPDPEPEPEPAPENVAAPAEDLDATQVMEQFPEPMLPPSDHPEPAEQTPAEQFAAEPALLNEWAPEAVQAEVDDATRVRPALPEDPEDDATVVREPPFDLYRDAPAVPPETPHSWTQQPTQALPQQAPAPQAPQPAQDQWAYGAPDPEGWQQGGAQVAPVQAAPVYAESSGMSRTLVGFFIGLLATLGVGGLYIVFRLLGA